MSKMREKNTAEEFTVTFITDVHHGDREHPLFFCKGALEKVRRIIKATPKSEFYINLGDATDYLFNGELFLYEQFIQTFKENGVDCYNLKNNDYIEGNRKIYNAIGNHEVECLTYGKKSIAKYIPYVDNVGCSYVFTHSDVIFVVVDANFSASTLRDGPSDIHCNKLYLIPDRQIEYLKCEIDKVIDESVNGIVWLSHISHDYVDVESADKLLKVLQSYQKEVTIFEGHTHVGSSRVYSSTGKDVTINVLAPVTGDFTLKDKERDPFYHYYNVTFSEGKVKKFEKTTKQL